MKRQPKLRLDAPKNATYPDEHLSLTPNQASVYNSEARFRVLVAGRRFGKTFLALAEIMRVAQLNDRLIWYVGPNDHQSKRIVWDRLKNLTRASWAKRPSESGMRIDLKSGSTIIVSGRSRTVQRRARARPRVLPTGIRRRIHQRRPQSRLLYLQPRHSCPPAEF